MQLTPVESSHVAAIGYLEAERVLLVRYKDGSLYAWPEIGPQLWLSFQAAESKGKWVKPFNGTNESHICDVKGVMPTDSGSNLPPSQSVVEPGGNAAPSPDPLNVIDEDADKCCRKSFANMDHSPQFWATLSMLTCGECGQDFVPEMVGPNRYWRIVPQVHIHRRSS